MDLSNVTDLRGAIADAEAQLAAHKAFSAANKPNRAKLAVENPTLCAKLDRDIEDSDRIASILETDTIPALRAALREAEQEAEREAVERDSAEFLADDKTVETKLIPGIERKMKALGADLATLKAHRERRDAINARRKPLGLEPLQDAEERVRVVPGYVKPERWEDRVVWRKRDGGQEVSVFRTNGAGEMVPEDAGAVRSVEKARVSREEHIPARRAESFTRSVVLPGFMPGDEPVWPPKGSR